MMEKVSENPLKNRKLPAFTVIVSLLITCYLTANVMAVKLINVAGITIFDAGTIIFPIAYMLGDVLTEIWGYKTAKRVIWLTFFCEIFFTFFAWLAICLPYPAETLANAEAYRQVFSFVPRVTAASLLAFLCGELVNAWSMEKIKIRTSGRHLWLRAIGSSFLGYIVDTTIFVAVAFVGVVPLSSIVSMILIQVAVKLLLEACAATPLLYVVVNKLKKQTSEDEEC